MGQVISKKTNGDTDEITIVVCGESTNVDDVIKAALRRGEMVLHQDGRRVWRERAPLIEDGYTWNDDGSRVRCAITEITWKPDGTRTSRLVRHVWVLFDNA